MNIKALIERLAYKLSGHKALFTIGVLALVCFHDFTPTNGEIVIALVIAVFGLKSVEKAGAIIKGIKGLKGE